jgi:hypothetical protein
VRASARRREWKRTSPLQPRTTGEGCAHVEQRRPVVYGHHHVTTRGVARVRWRPARAVKWQLQLTSGPRLLFHNFKDFLITQTLKYELVTFPLSKILQIMPVDSLKYKEQLYFLDQLKNPSGLHVINSGTNSNLNLPKILKKFKPF